MNRNCSLGGKKGLKHIKPKARSNLIRINKIKSTHTKETLALDKGDADDLNTQGKAQVEKMGN